MNKKDQHDSNFSKVIEEVLNKNETKEITLDELMAILGPYGHYSLMLFFIMPFLQPIPLFGLSTPFGIMIGIISLFSFFERPPWIPLSWKNRTLSQSLTKKIGAMFLPLIKKVEFSIGIKARFLFLFSNYLKFLNHILIFIQAILLSLPLPIPFSNALPAWSIFLFIFSYLEKDGLLMTLGYILSAVTIFFFSILFWSSTMGLNKFISFF